MKKPVLIVIDMLRDSLESWEPARKERLVHAINELVSAARILSHPVIWVRQEFESDLRDAFPEPKEFASQSKEQRVAKSFRSWHSPPQTLSSSRNGTALFTEPLLTKHLPGSHPMRSSWPGSILTPAFARLPLTPTKEIGL
jgi:nicotinamidase-related amidase